MKPIEKASITQTQMKLKLKLRNSKIRQHLSSAESVRSCSSLESSAIEAGIEAQSVDQGRAGKLFGQAENGCEQFGVNIQRLLVLSNP